MVEATATELSQDLGAGLAAPQPASLVPTSVVAPNAAALERRIETLEQNSARQERVFRRLVDLLSAVADR